MCQFLSAIVTKNDVYYDVFDDSHEALIKKHRLNDNGNNPDFVRVEITHQNRDISNTNLDEWTLRVDQDYTPNWFDKKEVEILMKKELKKVFRKYYIINAELELLKDKKIKILKDSKIKTMENSQVSVMRENSQVSVMGENSRVSVMRENSRVSVMWENSRVSEMWENSQVSVMRENSQVSVMWENSRVSEMWGNSLIRNNYEIITPNKDLKIRIWKD